MNMQTLIRNGSRRDVLAIGGLAALVAVLAPRMALADEKAVQAEINKLYGNKKLGEGRIKLDVPQIAENGLVVPINVEIESPMSADDYVKSVHVFADGNPLPNVVSYRFTPEAKAKATAFLALVKGDFAKAVALLESVAE